MNISSILAIIYLLNSVLSNNINNDYINSEKELWKPYYQDLTPRDTVSQWLIPFNTKNRKDLRTIGIVSVFGANRVTYLKGHIHTGLDMVPKPNDDTISVYPMAEGIVCSIHLADPLCTVVIKHILKDGSILFTSYKHLAEIYVKTGDNVNHDTKLGRVYTKNESKKYHGNFYHLHLEVRKLFDDYGCASWLTFSREELEKRFYDPLEFMRKMIVSY